MEAQTDTDWVTEYDDRFAYKRRRGDDTIKAKKPLNVDGGRDRWEVIARIGDSIQHTEHEDEDRAMKMVKIIEVVR